MLKLALTIWTLFTCLTGGVCPLQAPEPESEPPKVYATTRTGIGSWYESGYVTACGGAFDPDGITVALSQDYFNRGLCGREVRITHGETVVYATITDCMPSNGRLVDLSRGTCHALGACGLPTVTIEY